MRKITMRKSVVYSDVKGLTRDQQISCNLRIKKLTSEPPSASTSGFS